MRAKVLVKHGAQHSLVAHSADTESVGAAITYVARMVATVADIGGSSYEFVIVPEDGALCRIVRVTTCSVKSEQRCRLLCDVDPDTS